MTDPTPDRRDRTVGRHLLVALLAALLAVALVVAQGPGPAGDHGPEVTGPAATGSPTAIGSTPRGSADPATPASTQAPGPASPYPSPSVVAPAPTRSPAPTARPSVVPPTATARWPANDFSSDSEARLLVLTNGARTEAGQPALHVDPALAAVARSRSQDMAVRGYFSHQIPPDGHTVVNILDAQGYCFKTVGENLAKYTNGSDEQLVADAQKGFMGSEGHRRNILDPRWNVIGIGAYKDGHGQLFWTVLFAIAC